MFPRIFQFPLSERTNCNSGQCERRKNCCYLSVSSIGTNELQQNHHARRKHILSGLSVSSIGTNELQPAYAFTKHINLSYFQFPLSERTNCNTTARWQNRVARVFQFPLSERTNCNAQSARDDKLGVNRFQFPLSERTNCNANRDSSIIFTLPTFQFPLSERTNCNRAFESDRRCGRIFQFPLSERTNCNKSRR